MLSRELQIGKAAEHLVCCDLILQGYNAILADQGLPFDVLVVSDDGRICRVQVKATTKLITTKRNPRPHYRFGLRHAKKGARRISAKEIDVIALVGLDTKKIAYFQITTLVSRKHGEVVQAVDLWEGELPIGRIYTTGTVRSCFGRRIEDHAVFYFPDRGLYPSVEEY